MRCEKIIKAGFNCRLFHSPSPRFILVQPSARHEEKNDGIGREADMLGKLCRCGFVLLTFDVGDWARALMPWPDTAVSRDAAVGLHARDTLDSVVNGLLPWLRAEYGNLPCIVGGYSLGGLFALWAAMESDAFYAVAAASPSVWIDGWAGYAQAHATMAEKVYVSLGDREEHCRNQRMQRVGDCVRMQHDLLRVQLGDERTVLEWNRGGHFGEEAERTARAFAWCMS